MLDIMMQTKIIEHRGIGGHEDGIDIFACYFRKEDIGPLQKECNVKRETIEWLLQIPEQAGYEYQTKVWRLETLDRLGLLDEEQYKKYATLVWNFVDEIDTAFTDKVNGIYYTRRGDKLVLGQNMEKTNEIKLKDSRNGSYISEAYLLNDEGKTIERPI